MIPTPTSEQLLAGSCWLGLWTEMSAWCEVQGGKVDCVLTIPSLRCQLNFLVLSLYLQMSGYIIRNTGLYTLYILSRMTKDVTICGCDKIPEESNFKEGTISSSSQLQRGQFRVTGLCCFGTWWGCATWLGLWIPCFQSTGDMAPQGMSARTHSLRLNPITVTSRSDY